MTAQTPEAETPPDGIPTDYEMAGDVPETEHRDSSEVPPEGFETFPEA